MFAFPFPYRDFHACQQSVKCSIDTILGRSNREKPVGHLQIGWVSPPLGEFSIALFLLIVSPFTWEVALAEVQTSSHPYGYNLSFNTWGIVISANWSIHGCYHRRLLLFAEVSDGCVLQFCWETIYCNRCPHHCLNGHEQFVIEIFFWWSRVSTIRRTTLCQRYDKESPSIHWLKVWSKTK